MMFRDNLVIGDREFRKIAAIAAAEAGLKIPEAKRSLVQSRITRRMRALGIEDCSAYLKSIEGNAEETQNFISALTTNVSNFFREAHHFTKLREVIKTSSHTRVRLWSAGCSIGQEPYSMAIEVLKTLPDTDKHDILILASDIDRQVLARAREGIYSASEMEGVPAEDRASFFVRDGPSYRVSDRLRRLVKFRELNLDARVWPMQGAFDVIFCRNVVIYFDAATQTRLWQRFRQVMHRDALLMLGHSERIHPIADSGFESVGITTYRRL